MDSLFQKYITIITTHSLHRVLLEIPTHSFKTVPLEEKRFGQLVKKFTVLYGT